MTRHLLLQVTDSELCDKIQTLFEKGIEVRLMVSPRIVSTGDYYKAQVSYDVMTTSSL